MAFPKEFKDWLLPVLPQLVREFGPTGHIYYLPGMVAMAKRFIKAMSFGGINFKEYYAVKALPNEEILKPLRNLAGCGFDCSSPIDLRLACSTGARGEEIFFTSNNTTPAEFDLAIAIGAIINVDDYTLIDKIHGEFPDVICARYKGRKITGNSIIGSPETNKYGVPYEDLVRTYREFIRRGAKRFKLHAMLCSNSLNMDHFPEVVRELLELCLLLERELGIRIESINMGGGFGIPYLPTDIPLDLELLGQKISKMILDFHAENGWHPDLNAESGRLITGENGVLVNPVINDMRKGNLRIIGVPSAMTALMRHGIYKSWHTSHIVDENGQLVEGPMEPAVIGGPICEDCDRLGTDMPIPVSTREGHFVITENTGAHALAMCFQYNGRLRVQEIMCDMDLPVRLIRREETEADYFATRNFVPHVYRPVSPV